MRFPLVLMPAVLLLTVLAVIVAEWLVQPAGVSSEECLSCHRLDEIGKVTTEGVPILNDYQWQTELHPDLDKPDCVACHTVHGNGSPLFEHDLLRASVGSDCTFCHSDAAPDDTLHSTIDIACGVCHSTKTWSDASFDHALLTIVERIG